MAQLVARFPCKEEVIGSTPVASKTTFPKFPAEAFQSDIFFDFDAGGNLEQRSDTWPAPL